MHSMPIDGAGKILDLRLDQPITAGCTRVGTSAAAFELGEVGMWVDVH